MYLSKKNLVNLFKIKFINNRKIENTYFLDVSGIHRHTKIISIKSVSVYSKFYKTYSSAVEFSMFKAHVPIYVFRSKFRPPTNPSSVVLDTKASVMSRTVSTVHDLFDGCSQKSFTDVRLRVYNLFFRKNRVKTNVCENTF